jgi:hypothetical protein
MERNLMFYVLTGPTPQTNATGIFNGSPNGIYTRVVTDSWKGLQLVIYF